jgi:hypothetical protein
MTVEDIETTVKFSSSCELCKAGFDGVNTFL